MKKIIFTSLISVWLLAPVMAQVAPTNNLPNGANSGFYWSRGGNTGAGPNGANNIFGTQFNSPVYTITNNTFRMVVNGTFTSQFNQPIINQAGWNQGVNTSGYVGISPSGYFNNSTSSSQNSPWSMLHLQGPNSTPQFPGNGWRTWMKTGVFMGENSDAMYVGLKIQSGSPNRSDAVINWSDDQNNNGGPDVLKFTFTNVAIGTGNGGTNLYDASTLDGLEVMRMQPTGNIGIGPVWTNTLQPQVRLDIFDDGTAVPNTTIGGQRPQLRLTNLQDAIFNNGKHTDFTADNNGHLIITPRNSLAPTIQNSWVGIGVNPNGLGKLTVFENNLFTGATNTHAGVFVNFDASAPGVPINFFNGYTTGIATYVVNPSGSCNANRIAGYFYSAPPVGCALSNAMAFAIVVPPLGGRTMLGFANPFLAQVNSNGIEYLSVNGSAHKSAGLFWTTPSDLKLKQDTAQFTDGLNVIRHINPYFFKYNGKAGIDTAVGRQIGILADSVRPYAPYAITEYQSLMDSTDTNPTTLLKYTADGIFYAAINAIKQLDSMCTKMCTKMDSMASTIDSLLAGSGNRILNQSANNTNVDLVSDIVLYQNAPNPFGESTIIKYYLPSNITTAVMNFMDETGRIIKEVQLTQTGDGQITINAQDLASGIYTYSLYVNGQNIQTRKMQKLK